ncbi:thiamine pyrophosphate-dependent dehydrogenase E1 component subunit alpha [uncultured Phenylobacterium sp.]|uniref:thiamine pyrophosphate-dependent dehydrogenase E1 component subunit alpha n=1 Tax=uncultured Phenylobacterium sp. TaxID=349273 RepID=UPI0025D95760|nr:thiamine pyrophosphate-dependent dehydrogenase E1 component subunit alpha [uncultured Phenylobacterium sp.]
MRNDVLADIFRKSLLTRVFEDRFVKLAMEGVVPPLLHPGAGQEVAQIAAIAALKDDDPVLYAHRGTGYMIARGVSMRAMLADCAGRAGGTNNGKGGIMHVVDTSKGIFGESGTLGGGLVISVGMGMAVKKKKTGQVVVHFFGDGGSNRGTFHESLNWAAVQKLPCVYICENNGWAVSVPVSESTAVENIADRAHGYGIPGVIVDGADPAAVMDAVRTAAERARSGQGPTLIEIKAIRLRGHYATDPQDYRADAAEVAKNDPLETLRARVISMGLMTEAEVETLLTECEAEVQQAVEEMQASPPLSPEAAFEDVMV